MPMKVQMAQIRNQRTQGFRQSTLLFGSIGSVSKVTQLGWDDQLVNAFRCRVPPTTSESTVSIIIPSRVEKPSDFEGRA